MPIETITALLAIGSAIGIVIGALIAKIRTKSNETKNVLNAITKLEEGNENQTLLARQHIKVTLAIARKVGVEDEDTKRSCDMLENRLIEQAL